MAVSLSREQSQAMRSLLKNVMHEVAPDEVILIDAFKGTKRRAISAGPMGFGVAEGVVLIFPVIWEFIASLIKGSWDELAKKLGGKAADWILSSESRVTKVDVTALTTFADALRDQLISEGIQRESAVHAANATVRALLDNHEVVSKLFGR